MLYKGRTNKLSCAIRLIIRVMAQILAQSTRHRLRRKREYQLWHSLEQWHIPTRTFKIAFFVGILTLYDMAIELN